MSSTSRSLAADGRISSVVQQSKIDLITILSSVDVPGSLLQNFFNVKF